MIIYKATNKINGKVYVGQTIKSLKTRKEKHKSCSSDKQFTWHFYNSIRKYGWNNFKWEVIDHAKTIEELNRKEEYWIKKFKSVNLKYGYNKTYGGNNRKMLQSIKNKIRKSNTGKIRTEEWCKNLSIGHIGRKATMKTRLLMSAKKKGRVFTEEHKRNKAIAQLGEKNPGAKLTNKQVVEIKHKIANGETNRPIAKKYGVHHGTISLIRIGKNWSHIKICN